MQAVKIYKTQEKVQQKKKFFMFWQYGFSNISTSG